MKLNKDKRIGKVLFIVEGGNTEPYILHKVFTKIFDYELNAILRDKPFKRYNSKINMESQIFVVNAEESNIIHIKKDNDFLNNLFEVLITEYKFDIENAAIYYVFDRDPKSNTDAHFIRDLLGQLTHSRENNENYNRQGLLLLSYPSIESFTASNFIDDLFNLSLKIPIRIGVDLKAYLANEKIDQSKINDTTILHAAYEMLVGLIKMDINEFDIDNFKKTNITIFSFQEKHFGENEVYRLLSLLTIALIDLGLIEEIK